MCKKGLFSILLDESKTVIRSFLASSDFCRLLITFSHRLDCQNDLIFFFAKVNFEYVRGQQQKHEKLPSMQRVRKHLSLHISMCGFARTLAAGIHTVWM